VATPTTLPTTPTAARPRAAVAFPVCAREGCRWTAWFSVHHVPVCSLACAQGIADEGEQLRQRAVGRSHEGTRLHARRVA